jgi:hypothetical protein
MKTLFVLASVMVVLFLASPNKIEAQKRKAAKIIEGTISGYYCGDNCYLTITDNKGKEHTGLCTAPVCTKWNENAMMPDSYKGKRVKVTVGKGRRLTGAGDVVDTMDAFTRIQFTESDNINFVRKLAGSQFRDDLLGNPVIRKRLQNLLGKERWAFMYGHWNLGTPYELTNDVLVTIGCMSHLCPDTNFIIAIDVAKNTIYVGIREQNRIKTYSERGSNPSPQIQQRIQHWKDGDW